MQVIPNFYKDAKFSSFLLKYCKIYLSLLSFETEGKIAAKKIAQLSLQHFILIFDVLMWHLFVDHLWAVFIKKRIKNGFLSRTYISFLSKIYINNNQTFSLIHIRESSLHI